MSLDLEHFLESIGIEQNFAQVYSDYLASGLSIFSQYDLVSKQPSVSQLFDLGITSLEDRMKLFESYATLEKKHENQLLIQLHSNVRLFSFNFNYLTFIARRPLSRKLSANSFLNKEVKEKQQKSEQYSDKQQYDKDSDSDSQGKGEAKSTKRSNSKSINLNSMKNIKRQ
jgi:hypothetical protein